MELGAGEEPEAPESRKVAKTAKPAASKPAASKPAGAKPQTAAEPPLSRKPASRPQTGENGDQKPSRPAVEEVAVLLRDLADPQKADATFWKISEAPKAWIPELINHVEDRTPSRVERIQMLIVDQDFVGESKHFLANRIHGLGRMEVVEEVEKGDLRVIAQEYTKMSYNVAKNRKGYRLVMDKFGGFPVGVVIRAGLINRFRGLRSPASSDDDPAPGKLVAWWREYFRNAAADLREVGRRKSEPP